MTVQGDGIDSHRETRVLVAGRAGFSEALGAPLAKDDRFAVVGSAASADEAVAMSTILSPDVVLVEPDLRQVASRLSPAAATVIVFPQAETVADQDDEPLEILGVLMALASLGHAEAPARLEISLN
jgi:chemotaxis response regulator CheB